MNRSKAPRIIFVPFVAMGLLVAIVGAVILVQRISFTSTAQRVPGVVVDIDSFRSKPRPGKPSKTKFRAVVEYQVDGETYQLTSGVSSNRKSSIKKGASVVVAYDPTNPSSAMVDSPAELWFLPVLFLALGTFFTVIGGVALLRG